MENTCYKCGIEIDEEDIICCNCIDNTEGRNQHLWQIKKESLMEISNCCGAIPLGETYDKMGMCSRCLENTDFYNEEEEFEEEFGG